MQQKKGLMKKENCTGLPFLKEFFLKNLQDEYKKKESI